MKTGLETNQFGVATQDTRSHCVKRSDPQSLDWHSDSRSDPIAHFTRRLVREGDSKDLARPGVSGEQDMRDSRGQDTGLAGASPCQDEKWSVDGFNRFPLAVVQSLEMGDVPGRCQVFREDGHGREYTSQSSACGGTGPGGKRIAVLPAIARYICHGMWGNIQWNLEADMARITLPVLFLLASLFLSAAAGSADDMPSPVVKVTATIPAEARTAAILGRQREGTGIVIDSNGLIVTIGYLVLEASAVSIETQTGEILPATIIGYDDRSGFGLLRVHGKIRGGPLPLGQSSDLEPGQVVLVAPFGGEDSAQATYVVRRDNFAGYWEYLLENAIFTSPPHPWFAGAALINDNGQLVGVGSLWVPNALILEGAMFPGNMFVPVDALKRVMGELISRGRLAGRPWLGLHSMESENQIAVMRVVRDGPAWSAGIRPGDIVLAVADKPVQSLADFYRRVWSLGKPGIEVPPDHLAK